jgi:hypothetical protein
MPIVKAIIVVCVYAVTLAGAVMGKETVRVYRRQY